MPPASAAPRQNQRLGVAVALFGMLMFALNDVMGKWLVATYSGRPGPALAQRRRR